MAETIRLFHACKDRDSAEAIMADGFRGANVWNLENVVFFADKPLPGFGGWSEQWIEIEIPLASAIANNRYEKEDDDWDDQQYHCKCFCFDVDFVNNKDYEFYLHLDRVAE
jgi:hypothetical protein